MPMCVGLLVVRLGALSGCSRYVGYVVLRRGFGFAGLRSADQEIHEVGPVKPIVLRTSSIPRHVLPI